MPGAESPRTQRAERSERSERMRAERMAQSERGARGAGRGASRGADRGAGRGAGRGGRARAQLSLEVMLDGAIEILDAQGESGLTLRGLAARLGGGVGSLYWYVRSKEEIIALATDAVVGQAADEIASAGLPETDDIDTRLASLRLLGTTLFTHLEAHPWAATWMLRSTDVQSNSLRYFELAGQQLMPLGLTQLQLFHGISAFMNYVIGTGGQMAYQTAPRDADGQLLGKEEFFAETIDRWNSLDPQEFPFAQMITAQFRDHDDFLQFTAGLDLILAGIRHQAETATRP